MTCESCQTQKFGLKFLEPFFGQKMTKNDQKVLIFLTRLLCKLKSCAWSQTNRNCQLYIRAPLQICPKMYRLALIGQLSN